LDFGKTEIRKSCGQCENGRQGPIVELYWECLIFFQVRIYTNERTRS
jgi:hypothetical protein